MRIFTLMVLCSLLSGCAAGGLPDRFSRSLVLCADGSLSAHCPLPHPRRPDLRW